MGLLVIGKNEQDDISAIADAAEDVSALWNEYGGKDYGFVVKYDLDRIKECREQALSVLNAYFPEPPGAFKRVAALLVFARLHHFFFFEGKLLAPNEKEEWLARIVALLIPTTLKTLRVNISTKPEAPTWINLDKWKGFPSIHYRVEFLGFLQWLDNYDWAMKEVTKASSVRVDINRLNADRYARMILAISLIIEAAYYLGTEISLEKSGPVRGNIAGCINVTSDMTALSYDSLLAFNYLKAHGKTP